jgi:cytochrome P450
MMIFSVMNDTVLTAQAIGFFLEGYETSSKALSFALHELAMNPDLQEKLRKELKASFDDANGNIDYDNIRDCVFLDNILHGKKR